MPLDGSSLVSNPKFPDFTAHCTLLTAHFCLQKRHAGPAQGHRLSREQVLQRWKCFAAAGGRHRAPWIPTTRSRILFWKEVDAVCSAESGTDADRRAASFINKPGGTLS